MTAWLLLIGLVFIVWLLIGFFVWIACVFAADAVYRRHWQAEVKRSLEDEQTTKGMGTFSS